MGVTVREFIEDTILKCDKTIHIDDLYHIYMISMMSLGKHSPEALKIIEKLGINTWNELMETAMVNVFTSVYGSVLNETELKEFIDKGLPAADGIMAVLIPNKLGDA